MGDKSRVRPGLSSPDQSQDVELTIDKQIDEAQHDRDEKEGRGPLGPQIWTSGTSRMASNSMSTSKRLNLKNSVAARLLSPPGHCRLGRPAFYGGIIVAPTTGNS